MVDRGAVRLDQRLRAGTNDDSGPTNDFVPVGRYDAVCHVAALAMGGGWF